MTVPDRAGQTWRINGTTFVILSTVVDISRVNTMFKGSWHDALCLDDEDDVLLSGTTMRFFEGESGPWDKLVDDNDDDDVTWIRLT